MNQTGFKGDVTPSQAWLALAETANAVLIDVRTAQEWASVGNPDVTSLGKAAHRMEWLQLPGMTRNESFLQEVQAAGIQTEQPLYLLCRSGVRSRAAALALAAQGYTCYNIEDGFEGQLNPAGQRGVGGWRAEGLPWRQT
jgi:rhodanese-related sulfurtransferase